MNTFNFSNGFGSDNHSGIHPRILESIQKINLSHSPSYGTDSVSQSLSKKIKDLFGDTAGGFFVFNGTAANVLSLKALLPTWKSVLCADISHLNVDECGAPEAIAGVKLIGVKTNLEGKLTPEELEIHMTRLGDQHFSQPGCLSITQPTEIGTVYSLDELNRLSEFAAKYSLKLHIDGARISNAVSFLDISFLQMLKAFPADALSFGGTKNGLLGGELVILWDKTLKSEFRFVRKQAMQLPSKCRFIAIQFLTYLENDLYLNIAKHSHSTALQLAHRLKKYSEIKILYPVHSNSVFIQLPKHWTQLLKRSKFFYIWDPDLWCARLMTSFDTCEKDIDDFCQTIEQLKLSKNMKERENNEP